jgi:DNA-binding MarR family transcriptional regulator
MQRKGTVQEAIRQNKPFRSRRQEGVLSLMLAADAVRARIGQIFERPDELTMQQYNVLRILRGAGDSGLPTLDIADRMLERTPGVTRLIDKLSTRKLVERERAGDDRRQVWCRITARGLALLAKYDPKIDELDDSVLRSLSKAELATWIELLDRVRNDQP